jgi:hypothetical protein
VFENSIGPIREGCSEGDSPASGAPDLGPLRALAEIAEIADATALLADAYGRPLAAGDALAPLAADIARALTEAGLALHHCDRNDPLRRLGGVCLVPVARIHDPDGLGGVVVSWTTHDLLSLDWRRWREYQGTLGHMNGALAEVLGALGFEVRPFGQGGAWIVTGRGAGR